MRLRRLELTARYDADPRLAFLQVGFGLWAEDHVYDPGERLASPVGGELSYYTDYDQEHALDLPDGPHGVAFETLAAEYNVSYMIGNDQPDYQSWARI